MAKLSPIRIYKDFTRGRLDKGKASDLIISLIENTNVQDYKSEILSIKLLGLIGSKELRIYKFLENLLISHMNENIRGFAASVIIKNFPNKAFNPITWALNKEQSESCLILIIKALEKVEDPKLKSLLNIRKHVSYEGNIYFPFGADLALNLNNKNVDDISRVKGLRALTNIKKLFLNFNQITEIKGLNNLINLQTLQLQGNRIREIKGLEKLNKLEYLYLNNNEISKIQNINYLPYLKSLQLYDNRISSIQKLDSLMKLEILNLRNNNIIEIKGLEDLTNLKRLDLSNNQISKIKGLENLSKLEFLDLSHNQISVISGIDALKELKFLDLRNNEINKINGLINLKKLNLEKLQHLYLGFNRISETEDFDMSNDIKILDKLKIESNNLPNSSFDFYNSKKMFESLSNKQELEIRDIKFISPLLKRPILIKEFKQGKNLLDSLMNSLWIIIWNNYEFEIFRLSKSGKITWFQKNKKRFLFR